MTIGEKIKKIRTEKGLTIKELAKKSGLTETSICGYENEKHIPNAISTHKIAKALQCKFEDLYNLE